MLDSIFRNNLCIKHEQLIGRFQTCGDETHLISNPLRYLEIRNELQMLSKVIYCVFLLILMQGNEATSSDYVANLIDNLKYIGPHNIHDTYGEVRKFQKSRRLSIIDAVKSIYHIKPITRELNLVHSDDELFESLIKREIAWNYPEYNQFGLLPCEELKFSRPFDMANYLELNMEGYRISIQKISKTEDYLKAAKKAKDLQTKCLIKSLEKGRSSSSCDVDRIPFCFSDSWQQIWWKEI